MSRKKVKYWVNIVGFVRTSRISVPRSARSCPLRAAGSGVLHQDCDSLKAKGVAAVYGFGTEIPKAAGSCACYRPIDICFDYYIYCI